MFSTVIVSGQGSIGMRHVEVLRGMGCSVATVSRRAGMADFDNLAAAIVAHPDAGVLLATETAHHVDGLRQASAAGHRGAIIVEKPLCLRRHDLAGWQAEGQVWVAYNLRFLPVVQALRTALQRVGEPVLAVDMHVGQDLNTWRPGRSLEESYSIRARDGGGVLRDLSHELDLALWLFGPPRQLTATGGRLGKVTIDSEDSCQILMQMASGARLSISLNYLDRPARRYIHANTAGCTLHADLLTGELAVNGEMCRHPAERHTSYCAMWHSLLHCNGSDVCSLDGGLATMAVIEACEASLARHAWITLG